MRQRRTPLCICLTLLFLFPLAGCTSPPNEWHAAAESEAACLPEFPYRDGWLGGDAAYSVALDLEGEGEEEGADGSRVTLWLFGDSFVDPGPGIGPTSDPAPPAEDTRTRVGSAFVHNSIGLSRCGEEGFEISYYWGRDAAGSARAFFDSGAPDPYWWLFDGFVHRGALYIGLIEVSEAPPDGDLDLPFVLTGMKLARVSNPSAPPSNWVVETRQLSTSRDAFPGSAMLLRGAYLYLYTFTALRDGQQPRFLTRIPLTAVERFGTDLSESIETLVSGGAWVRGIHPQRALLLMDDNASEMSVQFHADIGRWVAVYGSPSQRPETDAPGSEPSPPSSNRIYIRTALQPEGPWSEADSLFLIPELQPDYVGGYDPNTVCYASKGHRRFSPRGRILVTYVCNLVGRSGDDPWQVLERLQNNMGLYRPRPVLLPLPTSSAPIAPPAPPALPDAEATAPLTSPR